MPIINHTIGVSECTATKLAHFKTILQAHCAIVAAIYRKQGKDPIYHYFDMNAGCGRYLNYEGSPLVAIDVAKEKGLRLDRLFFEKKKRNAILLQQNTGAEFVYRDHRRCLPCVCGIRPDQPTGRCEKCRKLGHDQFNGNGYGLIYHDPTRTRDISFRTLAVVSEKLPIIDILIYLSATAIKRVSGAFGRERLQQLLGPIHKKYWFLRQPDSADQWTFIFGTNWKDFPQLKSIGFYSLESPIGKDIFARLDKTKNEFAQSYRMQQPTLF